MLRHRMATASAVAIATFHSISTFVAKKYSHHVDTAAGEVASSLRDAVPGVRPDRRVSVALKLASSLSLPSSCFSGTSNLRCVSYLCPLES